MAKIGYFFARRAFRRVARQNGPAPRQWRRVPRSRRRRYQEPWRNRCTGICRGHRNRLRDGSASTSRPNSRYAELCRRRRSAIGSLAPSNRRSAAEGISLACVTTNHSLRRSWRRLLPARARSSPMPTLSTMSTPPTNGSCSARASASAISRTRARRPRRWRHGGRAALPTQAARRTTSTSSSSRLDAGLHLSCRRDAGPGCTRHPHGAAFDLQAVCSGFVFALATADKFLTSGSHKRALVIGAETFSRLLDWSDRTTCVLFGDGAGAVVLEAQDSDGGVATTRRPHHASALRRAAPRKALCRRRPVGDRHGRPSAHGRARSVPPCGRHGDRRRSRTRSPRPAHAPTISTGSCRIRPTAGSSTHRPKSSASRPKKSS